MDKSLVIFFVVCGTLWGISIFFGSIVPMLWENHKWLRENVPFLRRHHIGNWTGENSARFRVGNVNYGYNADTNHVYVIVHGDINQPSLQISIDPKLDKKTAHGYMVPFSIWGVVWPWQYLRREKTLPMNFTQYDMYNLPESELGALPKQHPLRIELEAELIHRVTQTIRDVRRGNRVNLQLLRDSLKQRSYLGARSFATWHVRSGTLIGRKRCMQIGRTVCKNNNFDLAEAELLLAQTKF